MSESNTNGDTVKVPKTFLYMIANLVIGLVLGGSATKGFTAGADAQSAAFAVEKTLDSLIEKVDKIDTSNKMLLRKSEQRINIKLDSLAAKLDDKVALNTEALINLDGYFKGYVESTKGN